MAGLTELLLILVRCMDISMPALLGYFMTMLCKYLLTLALWFT